MNLKSNWVRNYSLVVLAVNVGACSIVLWFTDFYIGFSTANGYLYQTTLDIIPFVSMFTLPAYILSGNRSNPRWLFIMLVPEILFILWPPLFWSFPYIVPFVLQLPLMISVRNSYHARPRVEEVNGRNA